MSFRKEVKFRLSKFDFEILKNNLCSQGMQTLYSKRKINSIYYDSELMNMFNDSEEGILPRKKIRIRWYELSLGAKIETKISSIEGRFKKSTPINYTSFENFPKKIFDQDYGILKPSLLVSYNREYFKLHNMRLTFDNSIKYKNYRYSTYTKHIDEECVMEIKVPKYISDDYIQSIIPYTSARFSKYSRGILISQGEL